MPGVKRQRNTLCLSKEKMQSYMAKRVDTRRGENCGQYSNPSGIERLYFPEEPKNFKKKKKEKRKALKSYSFLTTYLSQTQDPQVQTSHM